MKIALEQLRIIRIDRERPKEVEGVRTMKKKGETKVFSADNKSQIKASATKQSTEKPTATTKHEESNNVPAPPPMSEDGGVPPPPPMGGPPPPPSLDMPKPVKKVREPKEKAAPQPRTSTDGRNALLDAIRNPQKLKHVDEQKQGAKGEVDLNDQSILNIIAKALVERRNAVDDTQEDAEDDNLEDWL